MSRGAPMRLLVAAILVCAWATAHADGAPRPTCQSVCSAMLGELAFRPICPDCPPFNTCPDTYHTDRPAFDACMAEHKACFDEQLACGDAVDRGTREHDRCTGEDLPSCCAKRCQGEEAVSLSDRATPWFYADVAFAGGVRHSPGDTNLIGSIGGDLEILFGPRKWTGDSFPFRIGPFVSASAVFIEDDVGAQLEGGVSALVAGSRDGNSGLGLSVQAGALVDFPGEGGPTRVGGMARVSGGFSTAGQSQMKFLSLWSFLEGQYLPASDNVGATWAVLIGFRFGPLLFPVILLPEAADPL